MSTITVNDGTSDVVYESISSTEKESIYRDQGSTLANPSTIRVAHTAAANVDGSDRHLIQFARTEDDADEMPHTGSVHVVIAAPRKGVTEAQMLEEWTKLSNLITSQFADIFDGFQPTD